MKAGIKNTTNLSVFTKAVHIILHLSHIKKFGRTVDAHVAPCRGMILVYKITPKQNEACGLFLGFSVPKTCNMQATSVPDFNCFRREDIYH